ISAEARPTLRAAAPTPHFLVLQNIHDLDKFPPETTDFGIFVGSPSVGTEAAGAKEHLGTASRVLSGGHAHPGPLSASVEVTGKLADVADDVELTIAPLDEAGKVAAAAIPLTADKTTLIG